MQVLVCKMVNQVSKLCLKMDERLRQNILSLAIFLLLLLNFYYTTIVSDVHLFYKCLFGSILLFFIIIFSIKNKIEPIKKNNITFWILWFLLGILQFVSGILVSLEYLPMACVFCLEFSLLFYIWVQRGDYAKLIFVVFKNFNILFVIYLVISIIFFPIGSGQYSGFNLNPNGAGQLITIALPAVLFLNSISRKQVIKTLYSAEIVMIIVFCYYAESRTALLAILLIFLTMLLYKIFIYRESIFTLLKKITIFMVLSIIGIYSIPLVNNYTASLTSYATIYEEMKSQNIKTNEKVKKTKEPSQLTLENIFNSAESVDNSKNNANIVDRLNGSDKTGDSLEDYSSGRTKIWEETISKVNFVGHPSREHISTARNSDVGNNVHNTYLQFAYDNGLLAGILFSAIVIYSFLKLIYTSLRSSQNNILAYYLVLFHVGFITTSILSSVNLPFLYSIMLLYYFTLPVVIDKVKKGINDDKN